mgnify:CR=1 FL=1
MANVQDLQNFRTSFDQETKYNFSKKDFDLLWDTWGAALGDWINKAEKHEDHWHGQMHGGINLKMRLVPESQGTDPQGNNYTEPEHFVVYVTLSKKALDGMESVLEKPVKNG